jgi:hypothetical protein
MFIKEICGSDCKFLDLSIKTKQIKNGMGEMLRTQG